MQDLALIKLGGSVITFKDRPLAANIDAIDGISQVLAQLKVPSILVHGGGSFGHYWSVKYDMHTRPASYDVHGVSIVHESMVTLNQIIVKSMIRHGLNPYGIPPSVFIAGHKPLTARIKQVYMMARSKVTPVTFGDVVHVEGTKYFILSGDALMTILAKVLQPSKVIFTTNVDGIYKDTESKELVREIRVRVGKKNNKVIKFSKVTGADVTGGMQRKVTEAFKIASHGIDVIMVNGLKPDRIVQAVEEKSSDGGSSSGNRLEVVGTIIKGRKK